jgi:FkbM family methyltransferase
VRRLINLLKLYLSVIRKDGFLRGVRNATILLFSLGGEALEYRMSNYIHPVWYRPDSMDIHLLKSIFYQEEYKIETRGIVPKVIVDLGANAGYASVFFAHQFPSSKIYSVEPEDSNFELLTRNTGLLSNVITFNGAIWGEDKRLIPRYENADSWSFSLMEVDVAGDELAPQIKEIEGISLTSFITRYDINAIDLLKIDIEAGELPLFKSDCSWLHHVKIIVVELHDRKVKGCSQALYTALINEGVSFTQKNMGYNTVIYNERFFT